ncbi:MAG: CCA tRNA nucleotidyltransferase [Alphaproteobacteria bacterium]|nr:CCA tRNA nucleotidyltransferase [Alphaproteobacteria bacterium]
MRIDPALHPWMTAPETIQVMTALGEARFVGGAVRNAMMGVPVADVDIAVPMPPEEILARLKAHDIKAIPTGLEHGTVTALSGGKLFEITALRKDVETDGRHAVIAFTDDWAEDAARRDFTINAMYAALDGEVFDYATGVEDLIAGRVRFMGDAATRIAEDYLRILRLFRFHAWYGKGDIDAEALHAAAAAREKLNTLSGERVAKELLRLMEAGNPVPVLRVMAATGILSQLLPGALQLPRLERLAEIDADALHTRDGLLRLAALLPDDAAIAHQVADSLRLSNADRARLAGMLGDTPKMGGWLSAKQARVLLYRIGPAEFRDRVMLKWAQTPPGAGAIQWRMLLEMADRWQQPRFALSGRDVMAAGVTQGPDVGRILAAVEDWWLENDFAPGEGALRDRMAALIAAERA